MDQSENKFFKYVWRFNALIIAGAAAIFVFLLGGSIVIDLFQNKTRERGVANVVNLGGSGKADEKFVLGYPARIVGTHYVKIPLYRDQSHDRSDYASSSQKTEVNYIFLNASTNESKWLLENTNQLFISDTALTEKSLPAETSKAVAIVYTMVDNDSDGDGRLTTKDLITLSTSNIDGTDHRKLIQGIDRLYSVTQTADDKVLVLYEKNRETLSELYSVPSMKQLSQQKISQVNLK